MSPAGRRAFRALGTGCVVATLDATALHRAVTIVESELARVDRACSRFRDDSDLARVNRAAGAAVEVDPLLLEALEVAQRAALITDGDLDPTVGGAMVALGYDCDFSRLERSQPAVVRVHRVAGWRCIELDHDRSTVRVPENVHLDLGATAKAWAADRVASAAGAGTGTGVLVNLGGDIAIAGPAPSDGWPVRVADRHDAPADGPGPLLSMFDGGLATSSTTVRHWTRATASMHHIVDPHTGMPAEVVWRTVSVAAASAVDANIAATTSIIRGARALAWLDAVGLPARLVNPLDEVVTLNGWPADEADAACEQCEAVR